MSSSNDETNSGEKKTDVQAKLRAQTLKKLVAEGESKIVTLQEVIKELREENRTLTFANAQLKQQVICVAVDSYSHDMT